MFGFEKCTERQKEHLDKLVDYFIFSLEGQAYIKEKLQEHDRKQVLRVNPMSLNTEKIQQLARAILKES